MIGFSSYSKFGLHGIMWLFCLKFGCEKVIGNLDEVSAVYWVLCSGCECQVLCWWRGVACGRVKSDLLSHLIRGKRSANAAEAQEGHPEPRGVFQEGLL